MKKQIDSELKHIAVKVPFNKAVIACANPYQAVSFCLTGIPKGVNHRKFVVAGYKGLECRVDVFEPLNGEKSLPALLYVHGGAFSYKASAYHKKLACIYAAKVKCRVYFPDYHLLPKYKYPAAYEDVSAVYQFLVQNAETIGIDRERIGVGGDSAGACIAALVCNHCGQNGLGQPCLQMLVYPLTDFCMQTDSMKKYAAFPMYGNLPQNIPDTYIETAEYDCLHDEGILYGKRLREAGADVTINETRGTVHGYDSALRTKIAAENINKRILFLKKRFYGGKHE